ncbi:MAG: DUF481 domain-containing protein [Reichenbachiella sp.]|uniref:DUF481 domain-containing protein n=1 Tax=Reichenbachiella sp. TaxID=2184521 RepID=UPI0032996A30
MTRSLLLGLLLLISFLSVGQNQDTVYLKNGHVLIGEIKILENGVLKVETEYSENDFTIEWEKVKSLKTQTNFVIILSQKHRFNGTLSPDPNNEENIILYPKEGSKMFAKTLDVVYLKSFEDKFWDRVSANVDAGVSITKASDTKQLSISGSVSYLYTQLQSDLYINTLYNVVQDTIVTERDNYGTNWKLFFTRSWYVLGAADFLKSDEQNLDLRTTIQTGIGRNILRNYKMYMVTAVGVALNSEQYTINDGNSSQSIESFGEIEYKIYGHKDITLTTKVQFFNNLTETERRRLNFTFDVKFDLPMDFYIGGNLTYNYDTKMNTEGSNTDYVIKSSLGWKF